MNIKKAFCILLIPMLLASALAISVPFVKAGPNPSFEIRDSTTHLPTETFGPSPCIGTHFTVEGWVNASDKRLYGVDLQIGWELAWINYVSHVMTIPKQTYPSGILNQPTLGVKNDVDETASMPGSAPGTMYWLSQASMLPALNFNGTGTGFTMEFVVVDQPPQGSPDVITQVGITLSTLADDSGSPVAHDQVNMTITIKAPLHTYPPEPMLAVEFAHYYGVLNNNFDVNIMLMNEFGGDLHPEWDVAGFDFMLTYNATLITGLNATIDPTGWFATFWPNGIFTVKNYTDDVTGLGWIVFLGIPGVNGTHTPPFEQGVLAAVHFKAIYEQVPPPFIGPTCGLNIINSTIAGFPHPERLYPPWNGSPTAVPIPHKVRNAVYHAPVLFASGIDIYQYYEIGWGKGINMPTDMLWPQKSMKVYAKVMYNLWPEQQKDVAFQVIDPHGATWGIFYNRTDSNGYAWIFVRLPWPCDDPEYYFGKWKIFATVDIACKVYNDTMEFKYDYRVRVWKTTIDKTEYNHGEYIHVTIEFGTYATHPFWALFTTTATDVTGVPFDFEAVWKEVGGAVWCTYKNDTVELDLYIPKFARAGYPATVWVGVMSQWPIYGGEAYYPTRRPETVVDFSILPS